MPVYATDLSDEQWLLIAPLIPRPKAGGRRRTNNERRVIDGILYLLKPAASGGNYRTTSRIGVPPIVTLMNGESRRLEENSAPALFHGAEGRWSFALPKHRGD